jgi:hypothetical protein
MLPLQPISSKFSGVDLSEQIICLSSLVAGRGDWYLNLLLENKQFSKCMKLDDFLQSVHCCSMFGPAVGYEVKYNRLVYNMSVT